VTELELQVPANTEAGDLLVAIIPEFPEPETNGIYEVQGVETMHVLNDMEIEANTAETLATLKKNREDHAGIVEEAREGYMKKAEEVLQKRLGQLREGKLVDLLFRVSPPQDHTKVYDTAIRMLELHKKDTIVLNADQVRNLEMDEWGWSESFYMSNSAYSETAMATGKAKGYETDGA
jgi:hypothetical protein